MPYKPDDEKKYFSSVIAAMFLIALAVFALVYSLLKTNPEDIPVETLKTSQVNSEIHVNPSDTIGPTMSPTVPFPTVAPPSN